MPLFPSYAVARNVKDIQGCRTVIALTHMRTPNDLRLAKEVEEIEKINKTMMTDNYGMEEEGTDRRGDV